MSGGQTQVAPVIARLDDKETKKWKFKQQVLLTLLDDRIYYYMKSMLAVFARIREHHKMLTAVAMSPSACQTFFFPWVDRARWLREMVCPSWRDAIRATKVWRDLGQALPH